MTANDEQKRTQKEAAMSAEDKYPAAVVTPTRKMQHNSGCHRLQIHTSGTKNTVRRPPIFPFSQGSLLVVPYTSVVLPDVGLVYI
jgi:hypothetical protein